MRSKTNAGIGALRHAQDFILDDVSHSHRVLPAASCSGPGPSAPEPAAPAQPGAPAATPAAATDATPQPSTDTVGQVIAKLVSSEATGAPVTGDWLTARCPVNPKTLNVMLDTSDAYSARICSFVFEGMLNATTGRWN